MLRGTRCLLRVQSHQKNRSQSPHAGTRFGRVYNRGFIRYGFGGFGMSVYSPKKDRRFVPLPPFPSLTPVEHGISSSVWEAEGGMTTATRSLSPNFRAFALGDGGVLMAHPSHKQIMAWGQQVLTKETAAAGGKTSMDEYVNSRIQAILADQTIENVTLSHWRRNHMWNLVKSHGKLQRRWGTPDFAKGARTTMFNNK
eukprot:gene8210-5735_t